MSQVWTHDYYKSTINNFSQAAAGIVGGPFFYFRLGQKGNKRIYDRQEIKTQNAGNRMNEKGG